MTLYSISKNARYVVVGFLVFSVLLITWNIISGMFDKKDGPFVPTTSPWQDLPSNAFGSDLKLPVFPALGINSDTVPQFNLLGSFPQFPDTAMVYQVDKPREKLDSIDKARAVATILGFDASKGFSPPNNDKFLIWENELRTRRLEHDVVKRTWRLYTVSYFQDPSALQPKTTNRELIYGSKALALFSRLALTNEDFNNSKNSFVLTKRLADRFRPVDFNESPEYAVATVNRQVIMSEVKPGFTVQDATGGNITEYRAYVYSKSPHEGSINMVIADEADEPKTDIYELNYTDFEYSNITSYYKVITPSLAWQKIQTGKGILVSLVPRSKTRFDDYQPVAVSKFTADAAQTEIAYYEPAEWSGYIYPIYIFRGTAELKTGEIGEFVFYVDAINE